MPATPLTAATFVTTKSGKTAHLGTASGGSIQTECGIGYGRRSYGRAVDAATAEKHLCKRCAEMRALRS